jgi:hypothetical protein
MKNDAFHILWYVNLYLYMDLMEFEINTTQYSTIGIQMVSFLISFNLVFHIGNFPINNVLAHFKKHFGTNKIMLMPPNVTPFHYY